MKSVPKVIDPNSIIHRLPERFKDGQIWLDRDDAMAYLYVYLGACLFFFLLYYVWKLLFTFLKFEDYTEKNESEKVWFLIMWTSQAHHAFVAMYATYLVYNSCQSEFGEAIPSENGGSFTATGEHWGWWKSEECYMEVNKGYAYNLLITIGFMTVEYFRMVFLIEKGDKLIQQTKWHHIGAHVGFGMALLGGYGLPGIAQASLVCEYSSIFLNYKDMFKRHRDTPLGMFNQIMFLITYTIFRICLFPVCVYRSFDVAFKLGPYVHWFRQLCMWICAFTSLAMTILNYMWYTLIIKGLIKMLQGLGLIKGGVKKNEPSLRQ